MTEEKNRKIKKEVIKKQQKCMHERKKEKLQKCEVKPREINYV